MTEDDMNLHMYLASDNSDDEEEDVTGGDDSALSKKELARQKMREALGLGPEPTSKSDEKGPVGDLQITFSIETTRVFRLPQIYLSLPEPADWRIESRHRGGGQLAAVTGDHPQLRPGRGDVADRPVSRFRRRRRRFRPW